MPQSIASWTINTASRTATLGLVCVIAMQMAMTATAKQPYPRNGSSCRRTTAGVVARRRLASTKVTTMVVSPTTV